MRTHRLTTPSNKFCPQGSTFRITQGQTLRIQAKFVTEFGLLPFRSPLLRKSLLFSFLPVTEMFYFTGCVLYVIHRVIPLYGTGFPHSDISGSKVARHLPAVYRRQAASFITIF